MLELFLLSADHTTRLRRWSGCPGTKTRTSLVSRCQKTYQDQRAGNIRRTVEESMDMTCLIEVGLTSMDTFPKRQPKYRPRLVECQRLREQSVSEDKQPENVVQRRCGR